MSNYIKFLNTDLFGPVYEIPLSEIYSLELTQSDNFRKRLALLFKMMQEMNTATNENELFDLAIDYTGRVLNVDRASIAIVDEEEETITLTALYGVSADHPKNISINLKGCAIGHTYLTDLLSYRSELDECTCPVVGNLYKAGMHSTVVAPIISGTTRFGTLNTANSKPNGYNNDDIHLFAQITAILATHLHKSKLQDEAKRQKEVLLAKNDELENLAYMDSLTQIYNRRYINNIIAHAIMQRDQSESELSIIILDIDFFKNINDEKGHTEGDNVLRELTKLIKSKISENDVLARWGGEEFLIACLHTNVNDAYALAEKLRMSIDEEENSYLKNVTVSLGVASLIENDSIDTLIQRADKAMYQSKKDGRNATTLFN